MGFKSHLFKEVFCRYGNHFHVQYNRPSDVTSGGVCLDCGEVFEPIEWPKPPPPKISEIVDNYYRLIYAVGNKYPGESRFETALRYIREAEERRVQGPSEENTHLPPTEYIK